jgi:peptidoglycan LD-endopeptidase LytH
MTVRLKFSALVFALSGALVCATPESAGLIVVWPTPNAAFAEGRLATDYIQPTESGTVESGLFGCVRSGGRQFHEGIDLRPVSRDRRGEATDSVFAAMTGVVRHVSREPGNSRYGSYIVLEHPELSPALYTLYAHLATITESIAPGVNVNAGDTLAIMGRSAGGYKIPRERAHLHFEVGLRGSDWFQSWYDRQGFGNANEHGLYNGMNLLGFDPLVFFQLHAEGRLRSATDLIAAQPVVVTARVARSAEPDFLRRYPSLLVNADALIIGAGWEVGFNHTGVPVRWRRLESSELADVPRGEWRIMHADRPALAACPCRELVRERKGVLSADEDLHDVLEILFGALK